MTRQPLSNGLMRKYVLGYKSLNKQSFLCILTRIVGRGLPHAPHHCYSYGGVSRMPRPTMCNLVLNEQRDGTWAVPYRFYLQQHIVGANPYAANYPKLSSKKLLSSKKYSSL